MELIAYQEHFPTGINYFILQTCEAILVVVVLYLH